MTNISNVIKNDLCTGCGTCVSLCQHGAITISINKTKGIYIPRLDEYKCSNCGNCYKVCPGEDLDFKILNHMVFDKNPSDAIIGNYVNCYVGHATDYCINYNSASGGLVTALLIFALEEGIINGAIVTRMKKDIPMEPEPFVARTKDEIIEASKSKYCPVPTNVMIREILKLDNDEKFAIVGLPCHIHGLRKAESINKKLKEKIVLHIGLICNHAPTFLATKFLFKRIKIKDEDVKSLDYRGKGWPGGMHILMKDNRSIFVPQLSSNYWGFVFNNFFFPMRCTVCDDKICQLSDISFGDAWMPELMKNKNAGLSLIVSRNKISEDILSNAISRDIIKLKKTRRDVVVQSQSLYLVKKKLKARVFILKLFKRRVPIYHIDLLMSGFLDYFRALFFYIHVCFLSRHYFWNLIDLYILLFDSAAYVKSKLSKSKYWLLSGQKKLWTDKR